jgi:hypothetical protein
MAKLQNRRVDLFKALIFFLRSTSRVTHARDDAITVPDLSTRRPTTHGGALRRIRQYSPAVPKAYTVIPGNASAGSHVFDNHCMPVLLSLPDAYIRSQITPEVKKRNDEEAESFST